MGIAKTGDGGPTTDYRIVVGLPSPVLFRVTIAPL